MNRYWLAALNAPLWLVLVRGVVVLVRYRQRAPRAVGLALPFVALLALALAEVASHFLFRQSYPRWANEVSVWLPHVAHLMFWAILPVAAMTNRKADSQRDD